MQRRALLQLRRLPFVGPAAAPARGLASRVRRFADRSVVEARGGRGGHGAIAIDPHTQKSSGGSGGRGGHVTVVADEGCQSLPTRHSIAKGGNGTNGEGRDVTGVRGDDVVVRVPLGTIVRLAADNLPSSAEPPPPDPRARARSTRRAARRAEARRAGEAVAEALEELANGDDDDDDGDGDGEARRLGPAPVPGSARAKRAERLERRLARRAEEAAAAAAGGAAAPEADADADDGDGDSDDAAPLVSPFAGASSEEEWAARYAALEAAGEAGLEPGAEEAAGPPSEFDLSVHGASVRVACGGKPGIGNKESRRIMRQRFKRFRVRPADELRTPGAPGDEVRVELELQTIADVGLVGLPSAGKSTLLGAVTAASPAIGAYPFTTLNPAVGICEYSDKARVSIADIPGLVEDAHMGRGLGHDFLRHVRRTRLLAFVVDASAEFAGDDLGADPARALRALRRELELYEDGELADRPAVVVAAKCDLPGAAANVERVRAATDWPVFPVSSHDGEGLAPFVIGLRVALEAAGAGPSVPGEGGRGGS